jgi:hypothetical protein
MTLSTPTNKVLYTCDGSTDTFPYTFRILDDADLYVIYTDLSGYDTQWTESTEYIVTDVGEEFGGNVVVEAAYVPASGTQLTIYREVPLTQETDYVENDPFHADTLESDLDRTIMIIQQLAELLSRVIYLSITDGSHPTMEIPNLADRSSTFLGFDSNGNLTVYDDVAQLIKHGIDNSIARYDGTEGIQQSGVFIDDNRNMTGIHDLTIDGTFYGDIDGYATTDYVDNAISNISSSSITISGSPSSDHSAEGMKLDAYLAGEDLVFGDLVYRTTGSGGGDIFMKADKSDRSSVPAMAMALATISGGSTGLFLLDGVARDDSWTWTSGYLLYVGDYGAITDAVPSSSEEQLQIIGIALTATTIRFNPEYTIVEIA